MTFASEINRVPLKHLIAKTGWVRYSCKGLRPEEINESNFRVVVVDSRGGRHNSAIEENAGWKVEEKW